MYYNLLVTSQYINLYRSSIGHTGKYLSDYNEYIQHHHHNVHQSGLIETFKVNVEYIH